MRRTYTLIAVAEALMTDPEARHWGYALARASGVRSGSLYPVLARMLAAGWLRDGWEPQPKGRPPRRYYEVTTKGRAAMEAIVSEERERLGNRTAGAEAPRSRRAGAPPPVKLQPPRCNHPGVRVTGGWCVPCQRDVLPGGLYADRDD